MFRLNENSNYFLYNATQPAARRQPGVHPVRAGARGQHDLDVPLLDRHVEDRGRRDDPDHVDGQGRRRPSAPCRRRCAAGSFIDYLYYTDYETLDPALYTGPLFTGDTTYTPAQATTSCTTYAYASPGRGVGCTEINFITADQVNGPLHTNDSFLVCGAPHFNGNTSTSWNKSTQPRYRTNSGCSGNNPVFANPGDPKYLSNLAMPPSNSSIKAETAVGQGRVPVHRTDDASR